MRNPCGICMEKDRCQGMNQPCRQKKFFEQLKKEDLQSSGKKKVFGKNTILRNIMAIIIFYTTAMYDPLVLKKVVFSGLFVIVLLVLSLYV